MATLGGDQHPGVCRKWPLHGGFISKLAEIVCQQGIVELDLLTTDSLAQVCHMKTTSHMWIQVSWVS